MNFRFSIFDFRLIGMVALLVIFVGCASPKYSDVPPASTWTNGVPKASSAIQLPPEPETSNSQHRTANIEVGQALPARGASLSFENQDRGPLWYQIERSEALPARWSLFAEGLAMPGTATIRFSPTNSMGIFRARWKSYPDGAMP